MFEERVKSIAYVAIALGTVALIPQVYQIIKVERADEISYVWLSLALFVQGLWISYGAINNFSANIIGGIVISLIYLILIGLKIYYDDKNKKKNNNKS